MQLLKVPELKMPELLIRRLLLLMHLRGMLKLKRMFFKLPKLRRWVLLFLVMVILLTMAMFATCLLVVCEMCVLLHLRFASLFSLFYS
jgi:hypothetical protein